MAWGKARKKPSVIESFPKGEKNVLGKVQSSTYTPRLSPKQCDELESLMEARNPDGPIAATITRLHGFLTNVVSGPMVLPSEWMPVIFGDPDDGAWETMDQARHAMSLVMRFYNELSSDLRPGGRYSILVDRIGDEPDTIDLADDWCEATCSA